MYKISCAQLSLALLINVGVAQVARAQSPLHVFYGSAQNDGLGDAIAFAGDVDADGYDDQIVGFWHGSENGALSGSATVYSGQDFSRIHTFHGDSPDDLFGAAVAGAGDVDADGYADVIVGAYGDDNIAENSGSARVFSGRTGSILYTFEGDGWQHLLGFAVAGPGDVDLDGYDDLLVGAPRQEGSPATPYKGYARVYSGKDGSVLLQLTGALVPSWERFGWKLAAPGDVNQDGHPDLLVGSYYWDPDPTKGFQFSYGQVLSGRDGSSLFLFQGSSADFMGYSVTGAGDVDGDGHPDLALGAPYMSVNGILSGGMRVFSGMDGSILYTALGTSTSDWFGISVAGVGDLDGDGLAEVLVGAPNEDALGSDSGSARVFSGPTGALLFTLLGDATVNGSWGPQFGTAVCAAGDVDQDGIPDLVVGAPRDNTAANDAGAVHVFSGTCLPPDSYCVAAPNSAGPGALISSTGSQSIALNSFTLLVQGAPPSMFGQFFYGRYEAQIPFGDGYLCVMAGSTGIFRLLPIAQTSPNGTASHQIDFSQPPAGSGIGQIDPGSTWNFQFWYRDPNGPLGTGFNLSNALSATFCL